MFGFLLRRLAVLIPTFIGVSIIAFAFIRLLPGDPVALLSGERVMSPERHAQISANLGDLMNRLVATWGRYDHSLINQNNRAVSGDAFTWLSDSTRAAMFAEASLSLTSNGDLRKKLWIGYLSAGVKVFGPMAVVGWPIALPVIGASIANMGLNIDQAVNGKTAAERKAGILGAVLSGIDMLFNLLVLKGPGTLAEVGPDPARLARRILLGSGLRPFRGGAGRGGAGRGRAGRGGVRTAEQRR